MPAPSPTRASYCGRFAPSPTGPLHFGSMVAAVASYLDARRAGGRWLVRMEDVDRPRTRPGADTAILRSLERYGLHWDGEVVYQSSRIPRYEEALRRLREFTFGCACSRREVDERRPYPGTCRGGVPFGRHARAWRLRVAPAPV